jgi:CheY-like chemotaxis protein
LAKGVKPVFRPFSKEFRSFPERWKTCSAGRWSARTIFFANWGLLYHGERMMQPLALVVYEKLLPGSQLVNRLQDLNYRVQAISDATRLVECAEQSTPMLVLVDLEATRNNVCAAISRLRQNAATRHLPVIAFGGENESAPLEAAQAAGATVVVTEPAILNHLPQLLEQVLRVE